MIQSRLTTRLWTGVLLANLFMAAVVGLALRQSLLQYREKAEASLQNYSLILAGDLSSTLNKIDLVLLSVAEDLSGRIARGDDDPASRETLLKKYFARLPELNGLRAVDAEGYLEYGPGATAKTRVNISDRDYFIALRDDPGATLAVSKAYKGRISGIWEINLARRLTKPDGSFAGIILASMTLEEIQKDILANVDMGKLGLITLWDRDFTMVIRYPDLGQFGAAIGLPASMPGFQRLVREGRTDGMFQGVSPRDGVQRTYSFRRIPGYPLSITVGMSPEDYLAGWRYEARFLIALGCLFTLLTLYSAWTIHGSWKRREAAMLALRNQEENYRSLVEAADDLVWQTDERGLFSYVCPRAVGMLGYEAGEMLGRSPLDFKPPGERRTIADALGAMENGRARIRNLQSAALRKDGSRVILETSAVPFFDTQGRFRGYRGIDRDITERVRVSELLIQSEKMASMGGLAAGMAHEINNPLSIILQSAQMVQRHFDPGLERNAEAARQCGCSMECVRAYLEARGSVEFVKNIREAGERAATIVTNMLDFARKSDSTFVDSDINELLDKSVELAASDFDLKKNYDFRQVKVVRIYARNLPRLRCNRTEIEQVILNLLKNAAQAMNAGMVEGRVPTIVLRTFNDGGSVVIEMEDNGPGMGEEVRRHVFEPFFTTKPPGDGTGLGLSVSWFIIVKNHGGSIRVESEPGRGARFIISLPLHPQERTSGQADEGE